MSQQPPYDPYQQPGQPYPPQAYYGGYRPAPVSSKSKIVAGVLGILLGGLGIHNFYIGKTTRGVVQLVLTLLSVGIASIWGLVEGILILVSRPGSPWHQDSDGYELQD